MATFDLELVAYVVAVAVPGRRSAALRLAPENVIPLEGDIFVGAHRSGIDIERHARTLEEIVLDQHGAAAGQLQRNRHPVYRSGLPLLGVGG